MEFWSNYLGSEMWVFDPQGLPPWRNLRTGEYANSKPSSVDRQFTPSGPYSPEDAQSFPYAGQYIPGFGGSTTAPKPKAPTGGPSIGVDPAFRGYMSGDGGDGGGVGEVPPLNPDDFYWKWDVASGEMIPAKKGESGATFSNTWWDQANSARANVASGYSGAGGGGGAGGPSGPTAAELAIERSKVDAQNLATFISATIAELELEIDAKRLSTEQALGEFNRRLDAFAEAGKQFQGIMPYTIPIGAEYAPGFQPGGVGEQLGIAPRPAETIPFDPFAMAAQIVADTPNLPDIGVPSGDALDAAIQIAQDFLGG